jgi:hypothetical protein
VVTQRLPGTKPLLLQNATHLTRDPSTDH